MAYGKEELKLAALIGYPDEVLTPPYPPLTDDGTPVSWSITPNLA